MDSTRPPVPKSTGTVPPPHRSKGLYDTLWPSDHGNTARQKYVVNGGLPGGFDSDSVASISNESLSYAQWMYTRKPGELYIYGAPLAKKDKGYFARVNSETLEVLQRIELPRIAYIGGALMHQNGDVYLVHGPRLYRFKDGDLDQETLVMLPKVNGIFTQYNGMLVGEDGNIITKAWALDQHDMPMIWKIFMLPVIPGMVLGLGVAALLNFLAEVGPWIYPLLVLLFPIALIWLLVSTSGSSLLAFFKAEKLGSLLVIDPDSLAILSEVTPPERCAFGRMAMAPVCGNGDSVSGAESGDEWLVIAADEHIQRWRYHNGKLTHDPAWTQRYRTWGDGSFPGTGPSIYGDQVYYTDNTFPIHLSAGYSIYRKDLSTTMPQQALSLSKSGPGYMFFSTVSDPANNAVLVWDTENRRVESRDLEDLSLRWSADLFNTDCIAVASDRGHVYATDHDRHLSLLEMLRSASRAPSTPDINKDFVVLNAEDGQEILRVPLGQGSPVASMIVPGMNNDVFVALRSRLFRIYVP